MLSNKVILLYVEKKISSQRSFIRRSLSLLFYFLYINRKRGNEYGEYLTICSYHSSQEFKGSLSYLNPFHFWIISEFSPVNALLILVKVFSIYFVHLMPIFIQFNGEKNRPLFGYYIFINSLIKITLFSKCNKAFVCLSIIFKLLRNNRNWNRN